MEHFLKSVTLRGIGELNLKGLIVVVGPNSSGKTQFLKDLVYPQPEKRSPVVSTDHVLRPWSSFASLVEDLRTGSIVRIRTLQGNATILEALASVIGLKKPSESASINYDEADKAHKEWIERGKIPKKFIDHFGPMLCTYLFMDNRLNLVESTQGFDYEKDLPKDEIQSLHMNRKAQIAINNEIGRAFGRGVGLDWAGRTLNLRIADHTSAEPPVITPETANQFNKIEVEGDGLRSYLSICLAMLVSYRPLCLIDEPESCLHPPQAYSLGRFIGAHATDGNRTVVVATHSSALLRGVAETGSSLTILRLVRKPGEFIAHRVSHDVLKAAISRPSIAADEVFDGLFADGVIIVEAHNDRMVYQAALLAGFRDFHLDAQFLTVEGTGGIAPAAEFYKTLRIPCAIISDLDLLVESPSAIRKVLEATAVPPDEVQPLMNEIESLHDAIKLMPPVMEAEQAIKEIQGILDGGVSWHNEGDFRFVEKLRDLAKKVERSRRIKQGTKAFEDIAFRGRLESLLERLKQFGLFLAPVGELENWMSREFGVNVPKAERAAIAIESLRKGDKEGAPVITFMEHVGTFLNTRRAQLVS